MDGPTPLRIDPALQAPSLLYFVPPPAADMDFSHQIARIVEQSGLDEVCPASRNPDGFEEQASVAVIDLSEATSPRVGGCRMENFVYPAALYRMYVLGEAVRQIMAGQLDFEHVVSLKEHNIRASSRHQAGNQMLVCDLMHLMFAGGDITGANELIDLIDRRRASLLMRALGCNGSDVTRKFLPRPLEEDDFKDVPSTYTCALHAATFLYAVETGAIGGGAGRSLIKGYMAGTQYRHLRMRAGLPSSASIHSSLGMWETFTSEAGIVEDGPLKYVVAVIAPIPEKEANGRMADFANRLHRALQERLLSRPV